MNHIDGELLKPIYSILIAQSVLIVFGIALILFNTGRIIELLDKSKK